MIVLLHQLERARLLTALTQLRKMQAHVGAGNQPGPIPVDIAGVDCRTRDSIPNGCQNATTPKERAPVFREIERPEAIEVLKVLHSRKDQEFSRICTMYHSGDLSREEGWQQRSALFIELRALEYAIRCLTVAQSG